MSIYNKNIMINWINGFDAGNKKEKYSLTLRFGTLTLFEIKVSYMGLRLMVINLGLEINW